MRIRTVNISDDVADVLRRSTWEGAVLHLPESNLERGQYVAVDKVIKALGGKWNRGLGGHWFPDGGAEELSAALEMGEVVDQKKTLEQFFTPPDLARRMAEAIDLRCSEAVLEPSAGGGALVAAALEMAADVTPIEIDPKLAGGIHRAMQDHFGNRQCPGTLRPVLEADFLSVPALPFTPDKVLMNPPFSGNQDIAHVMHAFAMLRPGGKLAAIMSPHFTFANDKPSHAFRELIAYPECDLGGLSSVASASVELLPAKTFMTAGTAVNAVLVIIEKAA